MPDLSTLTVAKLKSLCKEKGLKNYSKLSKPALLEKLGAAGSGPKFFENIEAQAETSKAAQVFGEVPRTYLSLNDSSARSSVSPVSSGLGNGVGQSRLEPRTKETSTKSGASDSTSSFLAASQEGIGISIPNSELHGLKRSNDTAFSFPTVSKQDKVSKKSKSSHTPSLGSSVDVFKVPDIPRRDTAVGSSSSANNMSVCASEPRPDIQYTTFTLDKSKNSYQTYATGSHLTTPSNNSKRTTTSFQSVVPTPDTSGSFPSTTAVNLSTRTTAAQGVRSQNNILSSLTRIDPIEYDPRNGKEMRSRIDPLTTNTTTSLVRPNISPSSRIVSSGGHSPLLSTPSSSVLRDPPSCPQKRKFNAPRPMPNVLTRHPIQTPIPPLKRQTMEVLVLSFLKNITIPPSLSQRKHLPALSLSLTHLSDAERANCVLVSRVLRYAVYVSAKDILIRWFSGGRLSRLLYSLSSRNQSLDMINLWPYLRLRQKEVTDQKEAYEHGWVPRFFRELGAGRTLPVSEELWSSPDWEEQLSVALRFIQTRICFALSFHALGNAALQWVTSTVIDSQQILENEVWSITAVVSDAENATFRSKETFFVLYQTCEVIGHPPAQPTSLSHRDGFTLTQALGESSRIPLRADWSSYVELRLPTTTRHLQPPLSGLIRSTNEEEFERGVAKVWLRRIENQGEEGMLKKQVAKRYVLGCVAGNSVSGEYKSTAKMAMEFACLSEVPEASLHRRLGQAAPPKINLYVPERHNVESVHFTSPLGPLHPDIAFVQTAGRQEATFVLRENGAVIGEDEGVPEIWMKLLGCSENGLKL